MMASRSVCGRRIAAGGQRPATELYRTRNGGVSRAALEVARCKRLYAPGAWNLPMKPSTSHGGDVQQIHDGQCGLCVHFGESHPRSEQLVSIRKQHEAPEVLVDECGHPRHASLHLM